jgi:hypothetical protein
MRKRGRYYTKVTRSELTAETGNAGTYHNTPQLGVDGLVVGESDTAVRFRRDEQEYAHLDLDVANFRGGDEFSLECLVMVHDHGQHSIVSGPLATDNSNPLFLFGYDGDFDGFYFQLATQRVEGGTVFINAAPILDAQINVPYHFVAAWNGDKLRVYLNAELVDVESYSGFMAEPAASPRIYIGRGNFGGPYAEMTIAKLALYENSLPFSRVSAHFDAAAVRGFPEQSSGERVAALVSDPLWNTDRVQMGGFNVQPAMMHGQSPLEEAIEVARAEQPNSHLFADRNGNPVYLTWDFQRYGTYGDPKATFGDARDGVEIPYADLAHKWDKDIFNVVPASAADGEEQVAVDADSTSRRGEHIYDGAQNLILAEDDDVQRVADAIVDFFGSPQNRITNFVLDGNGDDRALEQLLNREIGDMCRFRRRGEDNVPIDIVAHIIGRQLHYEGTRLTMTWTLSRGFDLSEGVWRLGIGGASEIGVTTVLA